MVRHHISVIFTVIVISVVFSTLCRPLQGADTAFSYRQYPNWHLPHSSCYKVQVQPYINDSTESGTYCMISSYVFVFVLVGT
jgi:hypothetical protein